MTMLALSMYLSLSLVSPLQALQGVSATRLGEPAAAAPREVREVTLRIEHERLLEEESEESVQDTVEYLRQDGVQALKDRHGVAVVDGAEGPEIIVALHWVRHDDSVYGVSVKTRRPGQEAREVAAFECECIDSGLSKAVLERLPAALDQLEEVAEVEPEPREVVDPEPPGPEAGEPSGSGGDELGPQRAKPLGAMGKAGIGLLAVGAVGAITGAVVFAQQRQFDEDDPQRADWQWRDFGPPGVGVMVAGGVVAVTGAVLLILDRAQARRARKVAKANTWLVPSARGLAITGRF